MKNFEVIRTLKGVEWERKGYRNYSASTKIRQLKYNDVDVCTQGNKAIIRMYTNNDNEYTVYIIANTNVRFEVIKELKKYTWTVDSTENDEYVLSRSLENYRKQGLRLLAILLKYGISKNDIIIIRSWKQAS